eukprot:m.88540 g.88540  ORF g.88540 m.88540 type:complete len:961 (+) comp11655_c0_seq1:149-3031(+)
MPLRGAILAWMTSAMIVACSTRCIEAIRHGKHPTSRGSGRNFVPPAGRPQFNVDWASFLARSDLTSEWQRSPQNASLWVLPGLPLTYDTAGFTGNGNVGVLVQATVHGSVTLVLGRTDVYDRRVPGSKYATGELLCDVAKLPLGNLTLFTRGTVLSGSVRVRLWDGEVAVNLTTSAGNVSVRIIVYGGDSAPSGGSSGLVIATTNASADERVQWRFVPADANADDPHPVYSTESYSCKNPHYQRNPPPAASISADGINVTVQSLLVGPRYTIAVKATSGTVVLATSTPSNGTQSVAAAIADARWVVSSGEDTIFDRHRAAWHAFYSTASFLSISHPRLEQFYWITQYKLGCGMGLRGDLDGDGGAMDHTSPWFLPNNGLFNWDLNIQMTWWSVVGANRVRLIDPLTRFLQRHAGDFCENVVAEARGPEGCQCTGGDCSYTSLAGPSAHTGYVAVGRIETGHHNPGDENRSIVPPGPLGDLVWALTNIEQAWRFTRNRTIAEELYPLLAGAANYYVHWLAKTAPSSTARVMNDTNFHSDNIVDGGCAPLPFREVNYTTYEPCQAACDLMPICDMWTFVEPNVRPGAPWCCLKTCHSDSDPNCPAPVPDVGVIAGVKRSTNSSDGRYHLPPTYSPEYLAGPGNGDTSYELALCRWGLAAALDLAAELGINDPRTAVWQDRLDLLATYPVSGTGLDVAHNLPFNQPHRHFSHLLGIVLRDPHLVGPKGNETLAQLSLSHWRSLRDPCSMESRPTSQDAGWVGFSYAASALMHARFQNSVVALDDLTWYVENSAVEGKYGHREGPIPQSGSCPGTTIANASTLYTNTFYGEGLGDPTGETPFGICAALQEMLVGTSATEDITIFPGFGTKYLDSACFYDLRVAGAFLVSACFKNGSTTFVSVLSEAGQPCRVIFPTMQGPLAVLPKTISMNFSDGVVHLTLDAGEAALIYPHDTGPKNSNPPAN